MRKLLVVVDMQNDFVDGSLGTKEAEGIVDRVVEEIKKYDSKDIFATRDTHPENYLEELLDGRLMRRLPLHLEQPKSLTSRRLDPERWQRR